MLHDSTLNNHWNSQTFIYTQVASYKVGILLGKSKVQYSQTLMMSSTQNEGNAMQTTDSVTCAQNMHLNNNYEMNDYNKKGIV